MDCKEAFNKSSEVMFPKNIDNIAKFIDNAIEKGEFCCKFAVPSWIPNNASDNDKVILILKFMKIHGYTGFTGSYNSYPSGSITIYWKLEAEELLKKFDEMSQKFDEMLEEKNATK